MVLSNQDVLLFNPSYIIVRNLSRAITRVNGPTGNLAHRLMVGRHQPSTEINYYHLACLSGRVTLWVLLVGIAC